MESPAYDLQKYYENQTSLSVTCTTGRQSGTDKCVTFYDSGGDPEQNLLNLSENGWKYPTIQVMIRGNVNAYTDTRELAEDVYSQLHKAMRFTSNSHDYEQVIATGEPIFMGYDDNNRPEWSINFEIMK